MAKQAGNCETILKVLTDDTRLAVVRQLMARPQQVNEINATVNLEQSLLSHHQRVLRDAGIVNSQREGEAALYFVSEAVTSGKEPGASINLGCCQLSFESR